MIDRCAYQGLDCRIVAEIQKKIVDKGKQNPISRALNAKNDNDAIVAWGRNLDIILNIFNVRSIHSVWSQCITDSLLFRRSYY